MLNANKRPGFLALTVLVLGCGASPGPATTPVAEPVDQGDQGDPASPPYGLVAGHDLGAGVVIGGQPTEEVLQTASAAGVRTVISLRMAGEPMTEGAAALVEGAGMRFVTIPMDRQTGLTEENAQALDQALSAPEALPAIVHCGSGNRVAALMALRAFLLEGLSVEAAVERLQSTGLSRLEASLRAAATQICEADPERPC